MYLRIIIAFYPPFITSDFFFPIYYQYNTHESVIERRFPPFIIYLYNFKYAITYGRTSAPPSDRPNRVIVRSKIRKIALLRRYLYSYDKILHQYTEWFATIYFYSFNNAVIQNLLPVSKTIIFWYYFNLQ